MRVLALATRDVTAETKSEAALARQPREWAEEHLQLAGFVAFQCRMRQDSPKVLKNLMDSAHKVAMITGDNLLTAVHVATEAGLTRGKDQVFVMQIGPDGLELANAWSDEARPLPSTPALILEAALDADLCVDGPCLRRLLDLHGAAMVPLLERVRVFARMTPADKETVLGLLNDAGRVTLMCGDGANDVGALKRAHVGVALLGGFGSLNTGTSGEAEQKRKEELEALEEKKDEELNEMGLFERIRYENERAAKIAAKVAEINLENKQKSSENSTDLKQKMMIRMQEETARLEAKGESLAQFKAMRSVMAMQQAEGRSKLEKAGGSFNASAAAMALQGDGLLDGMEDAAMPTLKLGDASVAAPFTSKRPSIVSVPR